MSLSSVPYPHLFSPIELAGKRLKNRIIHASILTFLPDQGRISDRLIQYTLNRAKGGAGAIVSEPLGMIHQQINNPRKANIFNKDSEDMLRRWATAVEEQDCRLLGQVQDPGRGRHAPGRNYAAIGASALPDELSWTMPHPLSTAEVDTMIEEFVQSSLRLKRCGFSGVELSGGHGHIFHQFLSPVSNVRTDKYGGSFEGRLRLLKDLINAIRGECGDDFIIGLKLVGIDGVEGGIDEPLCKRIVDALTLQCQIEYLCFAQGSHHHSLEMHVPDGNYPRVPYRSLIASLREVSNGVPVAALGRITDPAEAEGLLAQGQADLVAMGRALIADAQWPNKALQGSAANIRYCVSGNRCWKTVTSHSPIACDNNPRVGQVDELIPMAFQPKADRKRVVIVGAGVAGLEAAWVAAARGMDVTVFGASEHPGGKTRLHAQLPGGEGLSSIYDFQYVSALEHRVDFRLGRQATTQDVLALTPDAVVLATGATMVRPAWLPEDAYEMGLVSDLRQAAAQMLDHHQRQTGSAVIFDMDHTEATYAMAELLNDRFDDVFIVTPRATIADEVAVVTRQGIHRRLHSKGIHVITLAQPRWTASIEDGALEIFSVYGDRIRVIENLAFLSYATPRAPNLRMVDELRDKGPAVYRIGDCKAARFPLEATQEGDAVARLL